MSTVIEIRTAQPSASMTGDVLGAVGAGPSYVYIDDLNTISHLYDGFYIIVYLTNPPGPGPYALGPILIKEHLYEGGENHVYVDYDIVFQMNKMWTDLGGGSGIYVDPAHWRYQITIVNPINLFLGVGSTNIPGSDPEARRHILYGPNGIRVDAFEFTNFANSIKQQLAAFIDLGVTVIKQIDTNTMIETTLSSFDVRTYDANALDKGLSDAPINEFTQANLALTTSYQLLTFGGSIQRMIFRNTSAAAIYLSWGDPNVVTTVPSDLTADNTVPAGQIIAMDAIYAPTPEGGIPQFIWLRGTAGGETYSLSVW